MHSASIYSVKEIYSSCNRLCVIPSKDEGPLVGPKLVSEFDLSVRDMDYLLEGMI